MMIQQVTSQQALQILRLRTVIVRAAQKDSLQWWEDESMTVQGLFLLERIFPGSPSVTGRNLAISAATTRHHAALQGFNHAIHLFRMSLINADQLALRPLRHHFEESFTDPTDPIPDLETLQQRLLAIIGKEPHYKRIGGLSQYNGLRIELSQPTADIVEKASALAWAYLEGEAGHPIFPYIVEEY